MSRIRRPPPRGRAAQEKADGARRAGASRASAALESATSASCRAVSSSACSSRGPYCDPQLLLMDEPTSGVDVSTRHDVLHLLADLHEDGLAIVLTTHDLNGMAAHLPHLVCVNGRIVADGTPSEVITPDVLEHTFGARWRSWSTSGCGSSSTRRPQATASMGGPDAGHPPRAAGVRLLPEGPHRGGAVRARSSA